MTKVYPAIIHQEDGFWVEFPDLPGCNAEGETLADAIEDASEALGLYLVALAEDSAPLPEPTQISDVVSDSGIVSYIHTDMNQYRRDTKAVKKMLSIPAWLAKEADEHHLSLSKVLQDALQEQLNIA